MLTPPLLQPRASFNQPPSSVKSLLVGSFVEVDVEELEGVGVLRGGDDSEPLSHEVLLPVRVEATVSNATKESKAKRRTRTFW